MRKKDFSFSKKPASPFLFLFLPMMILFVLSLIAFVWTSFWKYEMLSAEIFARGMIYEIIKYWTQLYVVLGYTELLVIFFLLVMIILESLFKSQIIQKSNGFCAKNRWILNFCYILAILVWLGLNTYSFINYFQMDFGFGIGVDPDILDSYKYKKVGKILIFSFQTLGLCFGSYYLHFRLVKKEKFLQEEYWVDATKGVVIFAITYLVVGVLKSSLSRVYYHNIIFGDLLENLENNGHGDWVAHYKQSEFKYGYNNGNGLWDSNIPGEWPWYKANGFFKSQENMPQYPFPIDYAFPSGHVGATYCSGTIFFLFLGKGRSFTKTKKILLIVFLIHLLSMSFSLVVGMAHWFSDVAFTHLFVLPLFLVVPKVVDKIKNKKNKIS